MTLGLTMAVERTAAPLCAQRLWIIWSSLLRDTVAVGRQSSTFVVIFFMEKRRKINKIKNILILVILMIVLVLSINNILAGKIKIIQTRVKSKIIIELKGSLKETSDKIKKLMNT